MPGAFHWIRLRTVSYATEKEDLLKETMAAMQPDVELRLTRTEGHHGNPMTIMESEMTKSKDFKTFFSVLGEGFRKELLSDLESRIEDDCTMYFRLDKQKAVSGEFVIAHHGDVISVSAKVVAHPARKEIALENMKAFLTDPGTHHN